VRAGLHQPAGTAPLPRGTRYHRAGEAPRAPAARSAAWNAGTRRFTRHFSTAEAAVRGRRCLAFRALWRAPAPVRAGCTRCWPRCRSSVWSRHPPSAKAAQQTCGAVGAPPADSGAQPSNIARSPANPWIW